MQLKQIVDMIAANGPQLPVDDSWMVVPLGLNEERKLLAVVEEPLSEEVKDSLRFMFSAHVKEIITDHDTFMRIRSFYRSRFGERGNGSGNFGEIDCEITWKFKCPKDWAKMLPTSDPWARHCTACDRNVVLCGNDAQVEAAKQVGACVAIGRRDEGDVIEMFLGGMG